MVSSVVAKISTSHTCQLLIQARPSLQLTHPWFLKIDPVWIVGMHVFVCMSESKAINN